MTHQILRPWERGVRNGEIIYNNIILILNYFFLIFKVKLPQIDESLGDVALYFFMKSPRVHQQNTIFTFSMQKRVFTV